MKLKNLSIYLISCILAMTLSGCGSGDEPGTDSVIFDIVTFESQTSGAATFTLWKPYSQESCTLTSSKTLDLNLVKPGSRIVISYIPASGEAYRSGEIELISYGGVNQGDYALMTRKELEGWDKDAVYLLSAWLSGPYLNIHARLPYDENPRRFALGLDVDSRNARRPDMYLVHALEGEPATFDRAYYASFNIEKLIQNSNIEGFTLHINNSNLQVNTIDFDIVR